MDALAFFNSLTGRLTITLTEPARPVSERLLNLVAPSTAHILSVTLELKVFEGGKFRPLTEEEWRRVVIPTAHIQMASGVSTDVAVDHHAPDARGFDVRSLCDAIARTEHVGREHTKWLGAMDIHHVAFEGLRRKGDVWIVNWGS